MKTYTYLALATIFTMSSCSLVNSSREKLAEMPEDEFQELAVKVEKAGRKGGKELVKLVEADVVMLTIKLTDMLYDSFSNDQLAIDSNDVVRSIIDYYELNLSQKEMSLIRDAGKAIDAAVGQIKLGLDGQLTAREKTLVLNLLDGFRKGLSEE